MQGYMVAGGGTSWEACLLLCKVETGQPKRIPAGSERTSLTGPVMALHCWWSGAYCWMPTVEAASPETLHANYYWVYWKVQLKALVIEPDSGPGKKKKKVVMPKVEKVLVWKNGVGYKEPQLD